MGIEEMDQGAARPGAQDVGQRVRDVEDASIGADDRHRRVEQLHGAVVAAADDQDLAVREDAQEWVLAGCLERAVQRGEAGHAGREDLGRWQGAAAGIGAAGDQDGAVLKERGPREPVLNGRHDVLSSRNRKPRGDQ